MGDWGSNPWSSPFIRGPDPDCMTYLYGTGNEGVPFVTPTGLIFSHELKQKMGVACNGITSIERENKFKKERKIKNPMTKGKL